MVVYNIRMESAEQVSLEQKKPKEFNPWFVYLFCLGISLVFMFFLCMNSPIYTYNGEVDYQWFMLMGRGVVAGKVPYRDLFEQKGPITYVVFAVACWFPHPQFVIWCFEVFCISLFLFFCFRIARKFLSLWSSLFVLSLMMLLLSLNSIGFSGGTVEEYCLPIFAYCFLCFLDFLMDRKSPSLPRNMFLGICIGILFWTKFTMLAFLVMPLILWFCICLFEHKIVWVVRTGVVMICGFALVTIPIVVWFAMTGALKNLFDIYFILNIFTYSRTIQYSSNTFTVAGDICDRLRDSCSLGHFYFVIQVFGMVSFTIHNWQKKSYRSLFFVILATWLLVVLLGIYIHYYLPMYTYTILGIVYLVKFFLYILRKCKIVVEYSIMKITWLIAMVVVCFSTVIFVVPNTSEINRSRENYLQLTVADIIAEYNKTAEQPATLFCYRMSDCGFYNAAEVVPNVYYYAQNSFTETNYPEMYEAFDETIRQQFCDFVITYPTEYYKKGSILQEYYHPYFKNHFGESILSASTFSCYGGNYYDYEVIILFRNTEQV